MDFSHVFSGIVVKGNQLGRTIGFPTANLLPETSTSLPPHYGVYAVLLKIKDQTRFGMANVGIKPTFGHEQLMVEVHIFDFAEDIYGEPLIVFFHDYVREEQKFTGLDALKEQIKKDEIRIREILSDRMKADPDTQ
jgi:riboflavin kinase/FMN adenylyltransferase